ncbi:MAG: chaplin family protein [Sphingomicrobium sp.]
MRKIMLAAALATATATTPAIGQIGNSQGLVTVTVQDVSILNNFLNGAQIAALNNLNVPITAQVPISVAANVCGTTVALLSAQRKAGDAACTATSGSGALAQQVARQRLGQHK